MKKFKIAAASTNSENYMFDCGFCHRDGSTYKGHGSHMIPVEGKEFFVYIQEPSNRADSGFRYDKTDWSGYDGFFTLVRMDDGKETLVDTGYATAHRTEDYTFYGKGINYGGTWSFHCENPTLKKVVPEKKLLTDKESIDQFVELIAGSKSVWMNPELQNIVAAASSPSSASKIVLEKTGSRKKAKAAHKLAQALKNYEPLLVRSAIRYLKGPGEFRPEKLKEFIKDHITIL